MRLASDSYNNREAGGGEFEEEPVVACVECTGEEESEAEDELMAMLRRKRERSVEDEAMRARVAGQVEEEMDSGVRIDPRLRGLGATRETEESRREGRRCPGGHVLGRWWTGAAGLMCDGPCGGSMRRGEGWWGCEACDYDICDTCYEDGG